MNFSFLVLGLLPLLSLGSVAATTLPDITYVLLPVSPNTCRCQAEWDQQNSNLATQYACPAPSTDIGISITYDNPTYTAGVCTSDCSGKISDCKINLTITLDWGSCVSQVHVRQKNLNNGNCATFINPTKDVDLTESCQCHPTDDQSCTTEIKVWSTLGDCQSGSTAKLHFVYAFKCRSCKVVTE